MGNVLISSYRYDVAALVANIVAARRVMDFGAGTFEHSLSLPADCNIHTNYRSNRNNIPYANSLRSCPLFAEIFDTFKTGKASFRLLRCKAGAAYSLHDDRDMGDEIVRMQIPIVANQNALFLIQKHGTELEPIARRIAEITQNNDSLVFNYPRLVEVFGEWFDLFFLEPGYLNLINTDKVHTLVNAGQNDRITLAIDLVRNDWLERWLSGHMTGIITPLSTDSLPAGTWEWSALRHGLLSHPRVQLT